ncbi:MAG: glycosyltransferase family 2 protein [Candidatus Omnitrophica bacterium]|nr:glycosyltransferase family 2 protein [Candidatus Omnitrophota bacterium]
MKKVSVIVTTFNSQDVIGDCLESLSWADEVLVCDSYSSDKTLDIAREFAVSILQHEYESPAKQKNWVIPQAKNEWILIIDSDERVSPELKEEIESVLSRHQDFNSFKIPRLNISFGRKMLHGGYWPDYQQRLFKKDKARYELVQVHEELLAEGPVGILKNPILHYPDRSISQVIEKFFIRYAKWEAEKRLEKEKAGMLKIVISPFKIFIYRYFLLLGFLDGIRGFIAAFIWSVYIFLTYIYMWQMSLKESRE